MISWNDAFAFLDMGLYGLNEADIDNQMAGIFDPDAGVLGPGFFVNSEKDAMNKVRTAINESMNSFFSRGTRTAIVHGDGADCIFSPSCQYGFDNTVKKAITDAIWGSCFGLVHALVNGQLCTPFDIAEDEWRAMSDQDKPQALFKCRLDWARKHFTHLFMTSWKHHECAEEPLLCIGSFVFGLALVDHLMVAAKAVGDSKHGARTEVFDILCLRPFREYTMGSGILLKKGSELGNTFRGWADFQLTDNIIAKTHIGHFTFWHASIVTNPKCLFLAEDIFCTNYIRGEGKKPLDWKYADNFKEDPMGTMQQHDASIICLPMPLGSMDPASHRLSTNNPISLNSKLIEHSEKFGQNTSSVKIGMVSCEWPDYLAGDDDHRVLEEHYKHNMNPQKAIELSRRFTEMFNEIWGFNKLNSWVDIESANTFETSGNLINTMCFHTMQKFQNPSNKRWEVTNLNTGHFGENGIYEGVKRIRCGFIDYFKEMDYQKSMAMGGMNI